MLCMPLTTWNQVSSCEYYISSVIDVSSRSRWINPLSSLYVAYSVRMGRHSDCIQGSGPNCSLIPVLISILGGWHPRPLRKVDTLDKNLAMKAMEAAPKAYLTLFDRHAAQLILSNVASLLAGVRVSRNLVNVTCS